MSQLSRPTEPITVAILILLGWWAIRSAEPPAVVDANAPIAEFSAPLAMVDVREIAKKPHPLGSTENDRVRDYLWHRLFDLTGHRPPFPFIEEVTVARHNRSGPDTWAVVRNVGIMARGTDPTGAVLMVAHYDSVPSGPGAGDDAASVAALIDTLATVTLTGMPLRNNLIILFTDGEELATLGAKAFVEDHSLLADLQPGDIKVVLNFEMRGDYGPALMFQTSDRNSWLIDQLAAAPFPNTTSAAAAIYDRLPNDTDLTVFLDAGMAGMNFAATGGITRYHTALDNADLLDQRTLQHQGSYAVAMARQFGSIDLKAPRSGNHDAIFFVVLGKLIYYPAWLALPFATLVTIVLLAAMWIGVRDGRFSIGAIAAGIAIYTLTIVIAIVEARAMWSIMAALAGWRLLPSRTTYGGSYFSVASDALIFGTLWGAYALISRWIRPQNLGAGALVLLAILMIATSIMFPAGSYIFTWPLLLATIALGFWRNYSAARDRLTQPIVVFVAIAPGIVMLAGTFYVAADGTLPLLVLCGFIAALLFGLFIPYIDFLTAGRRWIVPTVLVAMAIVMIVKGNAASNFDASQPHPDSIFYFLDSDRGSARWVSLDSRPDRFTSQFFQHHVRGGWLPRLTGLATEDTPVRGLPDVATSRDFAHLNRGRTTEGDAPLTNAAPPELKVLDDSTIAGNRTVKMHIASARAASIIWMSVPVGVTVLGSSIDGKSAGDRVTDGWTGWYWRAPVGGFDLSLKLATPAPFVVTVIDQTDGLPHLPNFAIKPRPPDTMPTPFLFFDSATLVRKTFQIGGERVARR